MDAEIRVEVTGHTAHVHLPKGCIDKTVKIMPVVCCTLLAIVMLTTNMQSVTAQTAPTIIIVILVVVLRLISLIHLMLEHTLIIFCDFIGGTTTTEGMAALDLNSCYLHGCANKARQPSWLPLNASFLSGLIFHYGTSDAKHNVVVFAPETFPNIGIVFSNRRRL